MGIKSNKRKLSFVDTRSINDKPSEKKIMAITADFKRSESVGNPPVVANNEYSHIVTISGWVDQSGGLPVQMSFGDGLAIRKAISDDNWGAWRKILHTNDFANSGMLTSVFGIGNYLLAYTKTGSISALGDTAGTNLRSINSSGQLEDLNLSGTWRCQGGNAASPTVMSLFRRIA